MSVFVFNEIPKKSKEAKKLTNLANRAPKAKRLAQKSGKCVTIYLKAE